MTFYCSDLPRFIAFRMDECTAYTYATRILDFAANNWQFIVLMIVVVFITNQIACAIANRNS